MVHDASSIGCTYYLDQPIYYYEVQTRKMYNLRKPVHNSLGCLQNLPECRQVTWQTVHETNAIIDLFHEFFNIIAGSGSVRKSYLHSGCKDAPLIGQLKSGVY